MKPTQQEIIELAREAGIVFDERAMPYYERLVHLALERFGAGGVEPVARLMKWIGKGTYQKKGYTVARTYEECPKDAYPNDWEENQELYTHPSPTNLRAEYLRGLEDAKKIASNYGLSRPIVTKTPSQRIVGRWEGEQAASAGIADAIEALKGKQ